MNIRGLRRQPVRGLARDSRRRIAAGLALALLVVFPGGCGSQAFQTPQQPDDPKEACRRSAGWWVAASSECIIDH
jgi:hypothetical protein